MLDYELLDVFTDVAFAGNPLAVVYGADELPTAALQSLATEFNLSETVFPLPPSTSDADYRLRIFTPLTELPFAGHPSVGAAWALHRAGTIQTGDVVQECGAGLLPVRVDDRGATLTGGAPVVGADVDPATVAAGLGLADTDLVASLRPGWAGCGLDYLLVAVRPGALSAVSLDHAALVRAGLSALMVVEPDTDPIRARMFAPGLGVVEDPATGSAALATGVWLVDRGVLASDGTHAYTIRQGVEMGRPSTLYCTATAASGVATSATVRGDVVAVGSGRIAVPEFTR